MEFAFLGVSTRVDVTSSNGTGNGAVVLSVQPGSPADQAGAPRQVREGRTA